MRFRRLLISWRSLAWRSKSTSLFTDAILARYRSFCRTDSQLRVQTLLKPLCPHFAIPTRTMRASINRFQHGAGMTRCVSPFSTGPSFRARCSISKLIRAFCILWPSYREIDNLTEPAVGKKFSIFIGLAIITPVLCLGESFGLFLRMRNASLLRKLEKVEKKKIEEQARYNYGATSSLRESFSALVYDHYFEKSDRKLYLTAIEKQLLDSILEFLESKNVDTSDLKEERTYIINSGLIVHGGLQTAALAVGDQAQAMAGKKPRAQKEKTGGKAA